MTYSLGAAQYLRAVHRATPHVHKSPLLPKSPFWCDRYMLARALSNDKQQLLYMPEPSLSMPEDVLTAAEKCGCQLVLLTRQDGSRLYAHLADWRGPNSFQVERGKYGRQRALPLRCMAKSLDQLTEAGPAAVPPGLFEVAS